VLKFLSVFRYDTRGQSHAEARHWSDENVLGGRAFFRGDLHPARLVIENVQVGLEIDLSLKKKYETVCFSIKTLKILVLCLLCASVFTITLFPTLESG